MYFPIILHCMKQIEHIWKFWNKNICLKFNPFYLFIYLLFSQVMIFFFTNRVVIYVIAELSSIKSSEQNKDRNRSIHNFCSSRLQIVFIHGWISIPLSKMHKKKKKNLISYIFELQIVKWMFRYWDGRTLEFLPQCTISISWFNFVNLRWIGRA